MKRLVIAWSGLPVYAAVQINELDKELKRSCNYYLTDVLATPSGLPIKGVEEILGRHPKVLHRKERVTWSQLGIETPDVFIHTGWSVPVFNYLGSQVRRNNGLVVSMIDNCWKGTLRQWVGALWYRIFWHRWFWAVIVPGQSGYYFCRILGIKKERIFEGLFGADSNVFPLGPQLSDRPKILIFVGRLISRKGVHELLQAFRIFHQIHPDWVLQVFGQGELLSSLKGVEGIELKSFSGSGEISVAMRQARVLVLPSLEDHWPLVVHEAVISGCAVITSDRVGNRFEFCTPENSLVTSAGDWRSLQKALDSIVLWDDDRWNLAFRKSAELSSKFSPQKFTQTVIKLLNSIEIT